MRKQSLRQTANRYLQMDNRGSFKDKQHRAFVVHKLIDDLFIVGDVPSSWQRLTALHVQKLVAHWQKYKISPATIMRYMTILRTFLTSIDCLFSGIDNQSLRLKRQYQQLKKPIITPDIWQSLSEPSARFIMAVQAQFGLTFKEAMRFIPDIHFRQDSLWITREIAFNSEDRIIPMRNDTQKAIIDHLINHTSGSKNLLQHHGYAVIRHQWHQALAQRQLPTHTNYRYLYAKHMNEVLVPILGGYQVGWLIREEMGIKSRNTLWRYLNE